MIQRMPSTTWTLTKRLKRTSPSQSGHEEVLSKFLEFLFNDWGPDLWIEVRRIAPPSQRFFRTQDIWLILADVAADPINVFVGVVPRKRRGGKAEDCYESTDVLWADIDKKSGGSFEHILSTTVLPLPNVMLDSGHGWHLYWKLNKYITTVEAQQLMGDIAAVLGGDAVGDPARIMRLPNTWNVKPDQPKMRTRILRLNDTEQHDPSAFRVADTEKREIVKRVKRAKVNGQKTRSEILFGIIMDGLLHGQSRDAIVKRMESDPAGSKLDEMPSRRRAQWIDNALTNAKQIISKRSQN